MQCALAAMLAAGYRPATSEPGHHQTMIQSLPLTLGAANEVWVVLCAAPPAQHQRLHGAADHGAALAECIAQATALRALLHARLKDEHPDLAANRRP